MSLFRNKALDKVKSYLNGRSICDLNVNEMDHVLSLLDDASKSFENDFDKAEAKSLSGLDNHDKKIDRKISRWDRYLEKQEKSIEQQEKAMDNMFNSFDEFMASDDNFDTSSNKRKVK